MNNMKKSLWIVLAVVAVLAVWGYSVYNGLVEKEEAVHGAWSNVETQYQRRSDLIPNLVNTVKGYAAHEQQTLAAVVDARSKATSMNVDADDLTPERLAAFQQAQEGVRSALGRLIAVAENDILRDEGEAMGRRLDEAGVEVTTVRFNGVVHDWGMLNGFAALHPTRTLIRLVGSVLRDYLEK